MPIRELPGTVDTLERLSRARSACRDLMQAFRADALYTMEGPRGWEVDE